MFTNWGAWLGIENENGTVEQEGGSSISINEDKTRATVAESAQTTSTVEKDAESTQLIQKAKGFSGKWEKSRIVNFVLKRCTNCNFLCLDA